MEMHTGGTAAKLGRNTILQTLLAAIEPLPFVHAAWQGGAAAFGRVDQWSDIDLVIVADDDRCDDVWPAIDAAIAKLSPVETKFVIPAPPLGLHSQRFYRLRDAGPFLLLDIGIFKTSTPDKLLDPEVHGQAVVHFDRAQITKTQPTAPAGRAAVVRSRLELLAVTIPLFQALVEKEINRGNDIEAIAFYLGWAIRPLVELLRIKHCPARYNFHTRYVQYDLPGEIVDRLRPMFYVRDLADLARRRIECEAWCRQLLLELGAQK